MIAVCFIHIQEIMRNDEVLSLLGISYGSKEGSSKDISSMSSLVGNALNFIFDFILMLSQFVSFHIIKTWILSCIDEKKTRVKTIGSCLNECFSVRVEMKKYLTAKGVVKSI